MAMPLLISSSSNNNQKQLGSTTSSNNYRNRSHSLSPSFINGGGSEPDINNGVSSNNSIQLHSNKFLSVVPSFNESYQQVMNGDSANHFNQTNRSFNGGGPQVINGVSPNHFNQTNRNLSVVPSFNGGNQQVINSVSLNYSNSIYRGLSLVTSFNDYEHVMNNGISSNYSSNQQELGFSVSSSNRRNRSLSLVPSFNGYEPLMNTGFSVSSSNHINRSLPLVPSFNAHEPVMNNGFSVSSSNHINRSLSLVPSFNAHEPVMNNGFSVSSCNHINRNLSLVPSFNGHEPVMNNGSSLNYSDRLQLGFPVSSRNNHQNRNLSLVEASFKIRGQPVNMIVRRRSFVRNYHFSYSAARLQATREVLRARLISIFSTRSRHGFSSQIHSQINLNNNSQQRRAGVTIIELDEEASSDNNQARSKYSRAVTLAPTPVSVYRPSATNNENDDDDGITHSLPYKKYGPYTCPRCFGKFPTSQKFAAHVSSHYKHETKAQRRSRLMAKIRRRNLRLHHSREGITLLPTQPVAQPEPTNMAEAEANGDGGVLSAVQVKEEAADF